MFNCEWIIFHHKREISHIKSMLLSCLLIKSTVNSSSLSQLSEAHMLKVADIMVCGPIAYNVVWGSCTPCDYEREGECEKLKPSIIVNSKCILTYFVRWKRIGPSVLSRRLYSETTLQWSRLTFSALVDPREGVPGKCPAPLGPISFIFMQFSAKIFSNNRFLAQTQGLAPSRQGNPGFASAVVWCPQ